MGEYIYTGSGRKRLLDALLRLTEKELAVYRSYFIDVQSETDIDYCIEVTEYILSKRNEI